MSTIFNKNVELNSFLCYYSIRKAGENMTIQEQMGQRIKRLREELKMSQSTLAELVGYKDKTAIAKVEAGKVDLPQSKISSFAKALKTNTSYLFGDIDNIEKAQSSTTDYYFTNMFKDIGDPEIYLEREMWRKYNEADEQTKRIILYALGMAENIKNKDK